MDIDIFNLPVYPDADLLPMLNNEEMADLVNSIEENGLRSPLVIAPILNGAEKPEMMLIDGRNRREACRQAGIKPDYIVFDGNIEAVKAFIIDSDTRRHNTKSQRAMRLALMYPEAKHGGNRKSSSKMELEKGEISKGRLSEARTILRYAPALADAVLAGAMPLSEAYQEAQKRKTATDSQEARFAKVQAADPELANLVAEERLSLDEAIKTLEARLAKEAEIAHQHCAVGLEAFTSGLMGCAYFMGDSAIEKLQTVWLADPRFQKERQHFLPKGLEWQVKNDLIRAKQGLEKLLAVFSPLTEEH